MSEQDGVPLVQCVARERSAPYRVTTWCGKDDDMHERRTFHDVAVAVREMVTPGATRAVCPHCAAAIYSVLR